MRNEDRIVEASERIKKRCREIGTTAAAVERDLGLSNGYINNMKLESVPHDKIRRIADRLGTTVDYLLYGITEKPVVVEIDRLSCERHMIRQIERLSDYQLKILSDIIDEMTGGDDGDR
jgi:transcriptional regulator with XRE-family HTH domain